MVGGVRNVLTALETAVHGYIMSTVNGPGIHTVNVIVAGDIGKITTGAVATSAPAAGAN